MSGTIPESVAAVDHGLFDIADPKEELAKFREKLAPGVRPPAPKSERELELEAEVARLQSQLDEKYQTPQDAYREMLRLTNLTEETAAEVLDEILFGEYGYVETFELKGAKRSMVGAFRTRTARDADRLLLALAKERVLSGTEKVRVTNRYNLADSIHRFGDRLFRHETGEDHAENLAWVDSLRGPVFETLIQMLSAFDQRVSVVCQKGAVENFWKPRGDRPAPSSTAGEG